MSVIFLTKMKDDDLIFPTVVFFNLICIERQAMLIRTVFVHV